MSKITINCHSSIRIENDIVIYIDPYKIEKEVLDADYIFLTHNHYDHFDPLSIKKIKKETTKFIVPYKMKEEVKMIGIEAMNIISVLPNNKYTIDSLKVETTRSYNVNKEFHPKSMDWCGYNILVDGKRIYIAGDTDFLPEMKEIKCDIALLPIGGTYTMTPKEAAECANLIRPKQVIPTHYNCEVGSLEDASIFKKHLDSSISCITRIK